MVESEGLALFVLRFDDAVGEVDDGVAFLQVDFGGVRADRAAHAEGERGHFDAALVSAVIKAESDFNAREVSNKGARGLMQLMPSTAERFGVTDSYDPTANIYAGVRYLHWLLQTFHGNADLAVAAYNAGEGNVWKYNGVPPFRETITYINRIAKHIRSAMTPAIVPASKVAESGTR